MLPARLDLEAYQGDDWERVLLFRPTQDTVADLTGFVGKAQIRHKPTEPEVLGEITVEVLDQTTDQGKVRLSMSSTVSGKLPPGRHTWDLQLSTPTRTWISGAFKVIPQVTR